MADGDAFDCFLSHNSKDKPAVRQLADTLRSAGVSVWLDEEQLRPGVPWQPALESGIRDCGSIAVLIGADGLGPWEDEGMQSALRLGVRERRPVIPVLLPDAPAVPRLPLFLGNRPWVDLRPSVCADPQVGIDRLIWGITGKRPVRDTSRPPPWSPSPGLAGHPPMFELFESGSEPEPESEPGQDPFGVSVSATLLADLANRRSATGGTATTAMGEDRPNPFFADSPEPIGRDGELARILEMLRAGNHCSLVGPPGSGKTLLLRAIRPRLPKELGIRPDQTVWVSFRTVQSLHDLMALVAAELGGARAADWRARIVAGGLRLLILDDLGGMHDGARGLEMRRWLRGLDDGFRVKLLMVSNERLDFLFRKDDASRDSPLMGLVPFPVELAPLRPADCARLVAQRLAGTGQSIGDYADLCLEARQPRDLLGRCAERFDRLLQEREGYR